MGVKETKLEEWCKKNRRLLKREISYLRLCSDIGEVDTLNNCITLRVYCLPNIVSYLIRRGWKVSFVKEERSLGSKKETYYEEAEMLAASYSTTQSYKDFNPVYLE